MMSSYKKRAKSVQRPHRERGQLASRQRLGILEKHKDYVLRARDYQRKQAQLKILREKARNRNPDEFYYKMVNSKLKDGRHVIPQPDESCSKEQLQLMKTQDLKYVQMKLAMEEKKIERLKGSFVDLSQGPSNSHTFFVDSAEEVASFDPGEYLPHQDWTTSHSDPGERVGEGEGQMEEGEGQEEKGEGRRKSSQKELNQRVHRCKQLRQVGQKMKTKKDLMTKGKRYRIPGDDTRPVTYRWTNERAK